MDFALWALIWLLTVILAVLIFQIVLHIQEREHRRRMRQIETELREEFDEWTANHYEPTRLYTERKQELQKIRDARVEAWRNLGRTRAEYEEELAQLERFHEEYLKTYKEHLFGQGG